MASFSWLNDNEVSAPDCQKLTIFLCIAIKKSWGKIMGTSEKGHVFFLADCQLPISLLTEKVVVGKCLPCFLVI